MRGTNFKGVLKRTMPKVPVSFSRILEKLQILADAAKYDVSCASSGSKRENTPDGLGDSKGMGICHSYTEDGRCVSLLKVLLTNHCIYDCAYCVSRKSNDVKRAAFTVEEVVELTINFYKRNYIEGLFLSSGIFKNADTTMERLVAVARQLREERRFNGYIHLKAIPGASDELMRQAGFYADRLSVNIEMPTEAGLKTVAPDKSHAEVIRPMAYLSDSIKNFAQERQLVKSTPLFAPAGQSTQMVIGATPENDLQIMRTAEQLYKRYALKRVYYSGYLPISSDERLPGIGTPPPLIREHRLYQSDWLMRFYGFEREDLLNEQHPDLDLEMDPKVNWALRHLHFFPVDINTADLSAIVRVPGIGVGSAAKIVAARRFGRLDMQQLRKIGVAMNRARYFIVCRDLLPPGDLNPATLRGRLLSQSQTKYRSTLSSQLSLF